MKTRIRTIVAGLVLTAALAAGVAYATIPAADGTINGCYRTAGGANDDDGDGRKGQLRVIAAGEQCKNNETAISWSQKGPQGDTGPAGTNGTNGINGIDGTDGQPGTNGTNGADGAPGTPGDPCLPSNPACVGPKGDKGETGEAGTNGTNGTNGVDGAPGTNGTNGTDGVSVLSAPEPAGANCANGGSRFTAANGVTYACNGGSGAPGGSGVPPSEAWHTVGALAEPLFQNDWESSRAVGYYKDPLGIVHLRGWAIKAGSSTDPLVFTLPPGYRPLQRMDFARAGSGGPTVIFSNGEVWGDPFMGAPFDGIAFRAEG